MDIFRNIDIGTIAIQFAVLLFSLSLHEASHAWMADRLGDHTARSLGRVTLNPLPHIDPIGTILFPLLQFFVHFPLIGWAKPVPVNHANLRNPRKDNIYVSVAGPASNLLAGSIAFLILVLLKVSLPQARQMIEFMTIVGQIPGHQSMLAPILGLLWYAMIINLLLALFNIIPIPPLDGHWVLYGLLPAKAAYAFARMGSYGFIILYALMYMGTLRFLFFPVDQAIKLLHSF